jgi:hypothetical protein
MQALILLTQQLSYTETTSNLHPQRMQFTIFPSLLSFIRAIKVSDIHTATRQQTSFSEFQKYSRPRHQIAKLIIQ